MNSVGVCILKHRDDERGKCDACECEKLHEICVHNVPR